MTTSSLVYVTPDELSVDRTVQRALNQRWASKITGSFNPDSVGALTISVRKNGAKIILDGQHRVAAARAAGYQGKLPAVSYQGLSKEEEAALFITLNTTQKVQPIDRFLVRVVEKDPAAVNINRLLNIYGWKVGWGGGLFSAVTAIEKVYNGAGISKEGERDDLVRAVLSVTNDAWGHEGQGVHMNIIAGLGQLFARFGKLVDQEKLANEMAKTRPLTLVGQAKALKDAQGGTSGAAMAKVLTNLHNSKRRNNRLPEWIWSN